MDLSPKHTQPPVNQQILDEAAEWFVDFREGDLDENTHTRFTAWLRRSPEHIAAYLEISAFWEDVPNIVRKETIEVAALIASARGSANVVRFGTDTPATEEPVSPVPPLVAATPGAFSTRPVTPAAAGLPAETPKCHKPNFVRRRISAVAAGGAAVAVGIAALSTWHVLRQRTYVTDVGEQRLITLDDGSVVELNAKTKLSVRLTRASRDIDLLEGQALFHVAKDPRRPFVVHSDDTRVRVIGTQFDVYKKSSGATIVTVVEGRVTVSANSLATSPPGAAAGTTPSPNTTAVSDGVPLGAGEQMIVTARMASHIRNKPSDVTAVTAWTQHQIVFQGTPLRDVVEEFNRYNRRQLVISDPELQAVHVSGVFSSTEPASFLKFLTEQLQLTVIEHDATIEITDQ